MADVAFAIPGDILTPTGGYAYDRHVLRRLGDHGIAARHLALPGTFPDPSPKDVAETLRLIESLSDRTLILIDGLAFGALPIEAIEQIDRTLIALIHHPLGLESGLSPARAAQLIRSERAALKRAAAVIVTSTATGRLLAADFDVPSHKLSVAEPGTEPAQRGVGGGGGPVCLLAVGSIVPRKGYEILVEALSGLGDLDWRLTIVGADDRAPDYAARIRHLVAKSGVSDRIALTGAVGGPILSELYAKSDLFVLASHFEGFGMVLTEALACGLPIITTTGGAAAETVSDRAAVKVPPGNPELLKAALSHLIGSPIERLRLSEAAWAEAQGLTRWDDTATVIANVLKEHGA